MEKYIIMTRYEQIGQNGKEFTKWFVRDSNPMTKEEANDRINFFKSSFEYIDKKTKLKHEYCLKDYSEYLKEIKADKKEIDKAIKKQEAYYKSDEYLLTNHINSTKRDSLNGHSPFELSQLLLDEQLLSATGCKLIAPDDVTLTPELLK